LLQQLQFQQQTMGLKGGTSGLLSLLVSLHNFVQQHIISVLTWYAFLIGCGHQSYTLSDHYDRLDCHIVVMRNKLIMGQ
jgi:hypothetical protein